MTRRGQNSSVLHQSASKFPSNSMLLGGKKNTCWKEEVAMQTKERNYYGAPGYHEGYECPKH